MPSFAPDTLSRPWLVGTAARGRVGSQHRTSSEADFARALNEGHGSIRSSWRLVPRFDTKPSIFTYRGIGRSKSRIKDWFHTAVHLRTERLLALIAFIYLSIVTVYAFIYLGIDTLADCKLHLRRSFHRAFFFSLETHATIGYGAYDSYFKECWIMMFTLLSHVFLALNFDAVIIGVVLTRLGRGGARAISVVFSDTALILEHGGDLYLVWQVFDKRRDALVEATVRAYCYVHDSFGGSDFPYYRSLKLAHPNLDDGGILMLCSPTIVVHKLDASSPIIAAAALNRQKDKEFTNTQDILVALRSLAHFEVVVDVNGIEGTSSGQVQARWSYVLDELQDAGSSADPPQRAQDVFKAHDVELQEREAATFESPSVRHIGGAAHVQRSAVVNWRNSNHRTAPPGQIARILHFLLPGDIGEKKT